jgi:peroxidase
MLSARSLATVLLVTALGSARAQAKTLEASFGFDSPAAAPPEFRSFDGTGNNLANPLWGSAGTDYARMARVDYADGFSTARLTGRPNPRSVGVALMRQTGAQPNNRNLSGYVYAFGNFLAHDTDRTNSGTTEFVNFTIPPGDDIYQAGQTVEVARTVFNPSTGTGVSNPRQQTNFTSAFIDGSVIYGSNATTASILRGGPANPGAKLRTSNEINGDAENLLPRNAFGPDPTAKFVGGDDRVNDNVPLTSLHTVFMREHNRLVDVYSAQHPGWSSEELYQRARKTVGAELQAITFNEYLPALLGPAAPSPTRSQYNPNLNPAVLNEFAAVFERVGHSMLTPSFLRIQNNGLAAPGGPVSLIDGFNNPSKVSSSNELNLFLKGLSVEVQDETDIKLVTDMRVALLDAFDIQRARDHGLPDYNTLRQAYGLARVTSFAGITSDPSLRQALASLYPNVNSIDPLVGALAEDHLPGASVGPLVAAGLRVQFERLRDADRFWYESDPDFTAADLDLLRNTRLSDIIMRNTGLTNLQGDVFFVPEPSTSVVLLGLLGTLACARTKRYKSAK